MTPPEKLPFAPVLRSLLEDEGRALDHSTPEQLAAYHAGRLSAEEAGLLERHLRGCQECSDLLRDLAEFEGFTPAPVAEALADRGAQAAWGRLQERLPEAVQERGRSRPMPVVQPPKPPLGPNIAWWRRPEPAYALAAALLLCVIGLSFSARSLSRRLDEASKPLINGAVANLYDDPTRGEETVVYLPPTGEFLSFVLHDSSVGKSSFAIYEVEVRSAGKPGGSPLQTIRGLERSKDGRFTFSVKNVLPLGVYQLELFGLEGDRRQSIAKYLFRLASP